MPDFDSKRKPVDRWLGLGSIAVGVAFFLIPKTPLVIFLSLVLIFVLLIHPLWNFWWVEEKLWRRFGACFLLVICLAWLGRESWPPPGAPEPLLNNEKPPPKTEVHNDIKLIFKNSPLFTDDRKQNIVHEMNSFYSYLIQVGYDAPKEVPTLGTYTRDMWFASPKAIYEHSVFIKETEIDNLTYIARMYARYAFYVLLKDTGSDEIFFMESNSYRTSVIYEDYYISSFYNKKMHSQGFYSWIVTLWEIRKKYGKEFTDKMLYFTFKTIVSYKTKNEKEDFDIYFNRMILHGVAILENDKKNLRTVKDVSNIIKSNLKVP